MPGKMPSLDALAQASASPAATQDTQPARKTVDQRKAEADAKTPERLGAYITRDEYQAMRAAYMADIDNVPNGPDTMGEWVLRAVDDHARKTPARRARAAADPATQVPASGAEDGSKQSMKTWPAVPGTQLAITNAQVADRAAGLPSVSVSRWVADAIRVAIASARERNGGTLPPPPEGRTPKRPRR